MKITSIVVPGLAVFGVIATIPADADAARSRSMHAISCIVKSGGVAVDPAVGQIVNTSTSATAELLCPIESEGVLNFDFRVANGQIITSGYSNGFGWSAKACVTFVNGGGQGGDCGQPTATPPAGVVHPPLDRTIWTGALASDFPFVSISLGPMVNGSANVIWGNTIVTP